MLSVIFAILTFALTVSLVATLVVGMVLYPRLHIIFDPLGARFEMWGWRPARRPPNGTRKPVR